MATGTATCTVNSSALNSQDQLQHSILVRGVLTFSSASDTYATGGLAVTFTPLESIKSDLVPTSMRVWSQPPAASPNTFYYLYTYNPGTTINGGLLQIWTSQGAGAEYGNSTALTNPGADVIQFEATFVRI
jgi:hypothetical protein